MLKKGKEETRQARRGNAWGVKERKNGVKGVKCRHYGKWRKVVKETHGLRNTCLFFLCVGINIRSVARVFPSPPSITECKVEEGNT